MLDCVVLLRVWVWCTAYFNYFLAIFLRLEDISCAASTVGHVEEAIV